MACPQRSSSSMLNIVLFIVALLLAFSVVVGIAASMYVACLLD